MILDTQLTSWLVALGIGLLLGIERERRKTTGADRSAAGVRTFAITALLGSAAMQIGSEPLLGVVTVAVAGLTGLSYYRSRSDDPGLTTEFALIATVVLGGLATRNPAAAAAIAVVVAVLLAARAPLHSFVRDVLTESELRSALIFAAATLIVWPNLPDRYIGPFEAVNLRSIWSVVVLVMLVGAGGYIAIRSLGTRYGLPIAGLASGFISSTATIASMGARVANEPSLLRPAVAGAVLSTVATVAQMGLVVAVISPPTFQALLFPLIWSGLAATGYALLFGLGLGSIAPALPNRGGEPFSIRPAMLLAAVLVAISLLTAALRSGYGNQGAIVAAAIAGFVDTHATAVSMAAQAAAGRMQPGEACLPILVGFSANSVTKLIVAGTCGSWPFTLRVAPGIIIVLAAAWVSFLTTRT